MRASLPVLLLIGCASPEGRNPGECSDGDDNDNDGLYDCDDPDCEGAPDCREGDTDTDADSDSDSDADSDSDSDADSDSDTDCSVGIDETVPPDGSSDAYYRADIEFWLDDPDPGSPRISLQGPDGPVDGTSWVSENGEMVGFTPTAPLEAQSAYDATLNYCAGAATIEFTTSALGGELEVDLVGRAFVVDLSSARFLEPPGTGELLAGFMTQDVLLGVVEGRGLIWRCWRR